MSTTPNIFDPGAADDFLITSSTCIIPEKIDRVKTLLMATIRKSDAMIESPSSFSHFKQDNVGHLWETYFQLFLKLGEEYKSAVRWLANTRHEFENTDTLQFFMEALVSEKDYTSGQPLSDSSILGHTFYIVVKETNAEEIEDSLRAQDKFSKITTEAFNFNSKFYDPNAMFEDEQEYIIEGGGNNNTERVDGKPVKRRRKSMRFFQKKARRPEINQNERWKMLENQTVLAFIYDMVCQNEQIQTLRLDEFEHKRYGVQCSPMDPNVLYNPFTAFYGRPTGVIKSQSFANMRECVVVDLNTGLKTLNFPNRKFVYKFPLSLFGIDFILGKRLPETQLNASCTISKMVPIALQEIHKAVNQYESIKRRERELNGTSDVSLSELRENTTAWEIVLEKYTTLTEKMLKDDVENNRPSRTKTPLVNAGFLGNAEEEKQLDRMLEDIAFRTMLRKDPPKYEEETDMYQLSREMLERQIDDDDSSQENDRVNFSLASISPEMKIIQETAALYGMGHLFQDVTKNGGKVNKLASTQLSNCFSSNWSNNAPKTANGVSANEVDFRFISVYSWLEFKNKEARSALENIFQMIDKDTLPTGGYEIKNKEVVKRKLLKIHKQRMFREYLSKARSVSSYGISVYEQNIIKFILNDKPYDTPIKHFKSDKTMGCLSNQEAKKYADINCIFMIADMHRCISLGIKYANIGLTRRKMLGCHMFLYSKPGEKSKTKVLEEIAKTRIEGTKKSETVRTPRADTSNVRNLNGALYLWDEVQLACINDSDPKNEQGRMMKERLTSCITTATRLRRDADGNMIPEHIHCETIGGIIATSNLDLSTVLSDPYKSRIHCIHVSEDIPPFRSVFNAMVAEQMAGEPIKNRANKLYAEERTVQAMVFELESLICAGAIDDVSMGMAWAFFSILQRTLKDNGIYVDSVRVFHSISLVARQNCILNCFEKLWFQEGAKYYGKPIEISQFMELDKMLAVSLEDVVCALGESIDKLADASHDSVYYCIWKIFESIPKGKRFKRKNETEEKNENLADDSTPSRRKDGRSCLVTDPMWITFDMKGGVETFAESVSQKSKRLCKKKVTKEVVLKALKDWSKCTIRSPVYKFPENWMDERGYVIGLDEDSIIVTEQTVETRLVDISSNNINFCYHYFKEYDKIPNADIVKNCITNILYSMHQIPGRYIFDVDSRYPFIRRVIDIDQSETDTDKRDILTLPASNLVTDSMKSIVDEDVLEIEHAGIELTDSSFLSGTNATTGIGYDLDTYSLNIRNETLHITKDKINGDYANTNVFGISSLRGQSRKEDEDTERTAACFNDDNDYHESSGGFFMGENVDFILNSSDPESCADSVVHSADFYRILDTIDESLPDDDFDEEVCTIRSEENGNSLGHWKIMMGALASDRDYKMAMHHPKVQNDLIDIKASLLKEHKKINYPTDMINEYSKATSQHWDKAKQMNIMETERITKMINDGELILTGYQVKEKSNGITGKLYSLEKDYGRDPYSSVELNFLKPAKRETLQERKQRVLDYLNGGAVQEKKPTRRLSRLKKLDNTSNQQRE